jgi:ankyrin repeat protein
MANVLVADLLDAVERNDVLEITEFLRKSTVLEVLRVSPVLEECLRISAKLGFLELAKLLLVDGAVNASAADVSGRTALHLACGEGHFLMSKALLELGAAVNARDQHGRTPLIYAAIWGFCDIVELLVLSGANVHVVDAKGFTPMLVAKNDLVRRILADYICELKTVSPT